MLMKQIPYVIVFAALLLGACGAEPAAVAPSVPPAATATEEFFLNPSSVPAPSSTAASTPPTEAPQATTAPQATAGPTDRMLLPAPTEAAVSDPPPTLDPAVPTAGVVAQIAPTAPPAAPSQPARLTIADIGVDGDLVSVGLDTDRIPIVPKHDIGWYNLSAKPGQGENIVLWGHVLRFRDSPKTPAPFARLKELQPGAAVVLYDQAGNKHDYVVTQQIWVTPDQVEYILPRGKEMITMVSCIGDKIISDGGVVDESHRLITIAEPKA
jgi:hypothetical protein